MSWLGDYMLSDDSQWKEIKLSASLYNGWFTPEFIELAVKNIAENFLQTNILQEWAGHYQLPVENQLPKNVGIVMAGNIPMVGFHDLLSVFISGHKSSIKLSSKDNVLIKHLVEVLIEKEGSIAEYIQFSEQLKNCDAYLATGSFNTSRYFEFYFRKYKHIIRRNKTSVGVLQGNESDEELEKLADDVYTFFGLGCRNVTKIFVPVNYDFVPLLAAFKKYSYLGDHNKYKNNYDYNLAILILNKKYYMTNGSILLVEDRSPFSPISQLHYEYYSDNDSLEKLLATNEPDLQCIVGRNYHHFSTAQSPGIFDYADKVDTMEFLKSL